MGHSKTYLCNKNPWNCQFPKYLCHGSLGASPKASEPLTNEAFELSTKNGKGQVT